MEITLAHLSAIMRSAAAKGALAQWVAPLNAAMAEFGVSTPLRRIYFLANAATETGELQQLDESLNYSAVRLAQVWPGHFAGGDGQANALAWSLAGKPEPLANYIYADANRPAGYKLGNIHIGDGWRYRGVSLTHLTGRANIVPCLRALGRDDDDTDYLRTPIGAARGGGWYWREKGLARWADADDAPRFRRAVQGGDEGLDRFRSYIALGKGALPGNAATTGPIVHIMKKGAYGQHVINLQATLNGLGITPPLATDGDFGPATEAAVRKFQERKGLQVDGVAGQATLAALGL